MITSKGQPSRSQATSLLADRALGAFLGVAVGDALGATVEFMTPREIVAQYKIHDQIVGGGWLNLKPGRVTDDTEMALTLSSALIKSGSWNLTAIADAFVAWMRSRPVDIGNTCRRGISRYLSNGTLSGPLSEGDGGNGAAMRNVATVLASLESETLLVQRSIEQAHLTHHHPKSDAATTTLARMTRRLLLEGDRDVCEQIARDLVAEHPAFRFSPWPGNTSGYIVDTVQTVFDAFFNTGSFEECLVHVVNRGGDADTTGAIAGQLAGALYGAQAIPSRWLEKLDPAVTAAIYQQTPQLLGLSRGEITLDRPPLVLSHSPMRPPENLYHQNIAEDPSRSSCSLNRCNHLPWIISSEEFQANPLPIEIDGARDTDATLFRRLNELAGVEERGEVFHDYVSVKFGLHQKIERHGKLKSAYSYADLLRAWGADSNRQAGAVLKAWVESRFGILATYHNGRLADDPAARDAFLIDRMRGAAKSVGVMMQLDLLYTFCQDELARRFPGERWKTLYRGTHDPEEYTIRRHDSGEGDPTKRRALVQLNNLSSFTSNSEVAWEFGSSAWEVQVPLAKIIFFSGLLPKSLLSGEAEYLVLGGYYNVRKMIC